MKKWILSQLNKQETLRISESMDIPMLLSVLLNIRNIKTPEEIERFLGDEADFSSPFLTKDMDIAADRIREAVESGEKICVYGDYDADGVTATALLFSYLESIGANVMYYIPSRSGEGYGMNCDAVDTLSAQGVQLIVTVDNGVSAYNEVEYANSLGIDTVITDHHSVPEVLPPAVAVVDMHRNDCNSTFKALSGVGVALKLVMAIEGEYCDVDSILDELSEFAAIGTIGDIVSLTGENRTIVKRGIRAIENSERVGIKALIEKAGGANKPVTSGSLAFTVVPRINAVGRLGLSTRSLRLLLTEDEEEAYALAEELTEDNSTRQQIEKEILAEIDELIKRDPLVVRQNIIVIAGKNWHQGVIGIVAARVKSVYGKPTVIISCEGDTARASGRSVEGFSLCDAVFSCSDLLTHYGGHPMAVGLSLQSKNVEAFRDALYEYTDSIEDMPYPELILDCKLNPALLDLSLYDSIEKLEPFGADNPVPVFGLYQVRIEDIKELSAGKHKRLTLSRPDARFTAMLFNADRSGFSYRVGDTVDLAVTLDRNEYAGSVSLSIIIREMKLSATDNAQMLESERAYEKFITGKSLDALSARALYPDRNDFAQVYRFLKSNRGYSGQIDELASRLPMNLGKLRIILDAMAELSLIDMVEGMYLSQITLREVSAKVSLESAPIISQLKELCV